MDYATQCPVCGCTVDENPVTCSRCDTIHHADCYEYAGGCAIFGCRVSERRLQLVARAGERLHGLMSDWHRTYYVQWGTCAAMVLFQVLHALSNAVSWKLAWAAGMGRGSVGSCLTFFSLSGAFAVATFFALVAYLYLLFPAWREKRRLEAALSTSLAPPKTKSGLLADKLALSTRKRLALTLLNLLRPMAAVVLLATVAVMVFAPLAKLAAMLSVTKYHVFELLISIFLASTILLASRGRLLYFETLKNRLSASMTHAKFLEKLASTD